LKSHPVILVKLGAQVFKYVSTVVLSIDTESQRILMQMHPFPIHVSIVSGFHQDVNSLSNLVALSQIIFRISVARMLSSPSLIIVAVVDYTHSCA